MKTLNKTFKIACVAFIMLLFCNNIQAQVQYVSNGNTYHLCVGTTYTIGAVIPSGYYCPNGTNWKWGSLPDVAGGTPATFTDIGYYLTQFYYDGYCSDPSGNYWAAEITPSDANTVSVTVDLSNCANTATSSITFTLITDPSMPGSLSPIYYCPGSSSINLVGPVGISGSFTWYWYYPGGGNSGALTDPNITYSSANLDGTYTLVLNNSGCSSYYSTVEVAEDDLTVSISGSTVACGNNEYCPSITGPSAVTSYAWSFSNTGNSYTSGSCSNGIDVSWNDQTVGGTINLTVTDANGCTASYSLPVTGCCSNSNGYPTIIQNNVSDFNAGDLNSVGSYFPYTSYSYTYPNNYTYYSAGSWTVTEAGINNWTFDSFNGSTPLIIDGYFSIDEDVTITNSEVLLGPDAVIGMDGGSLTLNGCHLYDCGAMWNGIVYGTGGGSLTIENCLIEDAKNAIINGSGSYTPISITGSALNRNFNGIVIEGYSGTYPLTISTSTISCNTSVLTI